MYKNWHDSIMLYMWEHRKTLIQQLLIGVNMKSTRAEYLNFFTNWLHYQFPRNADIVHNVLITREVRLIVDTDSEAAYWGDRDCWTMHDIANKRIQARAIEAVTAWETSSLP